MVNMSDNNDDVCSILFMSVLCSCGCRRSPQSSCGLHVLFSFFLLWFLTSGKSGCCVRKRERVPGTATTLIWFHARVCV